MASDPVVLGVAMNDVYAELQDAYTRQQRDRFVSESDVDTGLALILAEMEQADLDAERARDYADPEPVRFGVRGFYTNEEW